MNSVIAPAAIVTFSGTVIEPLSPDPEKIGLEDIAHALANQCRFTGHTKEFYSVAQHSVLVSEICDWDDALWGLLHDATEAYLSDIARPIKKHTDWGQGYLAAENDLMRMVCVAFELPPEMPESVRWADDVLLRSEMRDLMPFGLSDTVPGDLLDIEIECWTPKDSKLAFLERYFEILEA